MSPTLRNILIIVAAAAVITAFGAVGSGLASLLLAVLSFGILLGLLYFGYTVWRDNRSQLAWLPQTQKIILYGAAGLLVVVLLTSWFWATTLWTSVLFFAIVGGCIYAIYRVWQESRRYY